MESLFPEPHSLNNPERERRATAIAHPNIALIKYWGKRDPKLNLPAVGSISITLDVFQTRTEVVFRPSLAEDRLVLNGQEVHGKDLSRVSRFLDLVREMGQFSWKAEIHTENNFPTGAGLASSASAFAALAMAATRAAGLRLDRRALSILARRGSGSAARSVFGGYVRMYRGTRKDGMDAYAEQIAPAEYFPLKVLVAVVSLDRKSIGSTRAMQQTSLTSPFFQAWTEQSPQELGEMEKAILEKDFTRMGELAERNCLKMHATMLTTWPPILYWTETTLRIMRAVWEMRQQGLEAYFTIDAGPQVKILCQPNAEGRVKNFLASVEGIQNIIVCSLGEGANLIEDQP